MKLIGILSDTHSCRDARYAAHFAGCDEIWHAGDLGDIGVLRDLQSICPVVRAVCGNVDHGEVARLLPRSLRFEVEGLRVYMVHIGGYPGRYAPGVAEALDLWRPGIFVSGHSHILKVMPDPRRGLLHINPGAAGHHGWQKVRTLVRLTIDAGTPTGLEVIELKASQ